MKETRETKNKIWIENIRQVGKFKWHDDYLIIIVISIICFLTIVDKNVNTV